MGALSYGGAIALGFVGGFVIAVVAAMILTLMTLRTGNAYGLGHWRLNAKMPLATMWMNLGYWTDCKGDKIQDFEVACASLLTQVLATARLMEPQTPRSLAVLDLGFGCGDQTCELASCVSPSEGFRNFCYVGLTLNQAQMNAASRTLGRKFAGSASHSSNLPAAESFQLFCADAAQPETWTVSVRDAIEGKLASTDFEAKWLLALDCLYHFQPSRKPIFNYAAKKLDMNIMAFDLILNEKASARDVLTARAIGVMMGCPYRTFLTEDQYRAQLVECGYDNQQTIIKDISEHVFPGVVKFLDRQEQALSEYGISLGGYKLAGRLFDWFGRSGVLKASIVVAITKRGCRST